MEHGELLGNKDHQDLLDPGVRLYISTLQNVCIQANKRTVKEMMLIKRLRWVILRYMINLRLHRCNYNKDLKERSIPFRFLSRPSLFPYFRIPVAFFLNLILPFCDDHSDYLPSSKTNFLKNTLSSYHFAEPHCARCFMRHEFWAWKS